ncbi:TniB family NTP-binding protein [Acinetobacter sp. ACZLY 512]|uniref:TniB family NTP-binding protein n=1 Tax=Acinetobacter sp. ACZLY 512 TaxID=2911206 RepID=UPI0020261273|nr:TniB family NTP-binding protein [Acinetobacter sp. ACZLY 512]MCL9677218.1 TniB family NTP-binding protein [Acinetobacter sp. ACZLY 512]
MSTLKLSHLSDIAKAKAILDRDERIEHILKPKWIGYPAAQTILDQLEDLLHYPKQSRMPNLLLVGETNNGKTCLIEQFRKNYPADPNLDGEAIKVPVLYVQAPPSPDERGLYNNILSLLFQRLKTAESTDQKRQRVISVLKQIDLGVIVIDEIHHLLAGPLLKQRNFLNVIKYLGNELCVPIVGVGTADAFRAIQIDPQIQNRFVPVVIPKWSLNTDFARLLVSFERILPLKQPSRLSEKSMATKLLYLSGGTIGELSQLLNKAAIWALKNNRESIDFEALEKCGFVRPSDRKTMASKI